ncbi:hypothetical protein [Crocosphaera sp. Alani8]|uniref:hypothetical protein n=1 Tax=Crocosphaera sp. Alani8 TaxID=3038952 RepID=UPI00313D8E15
MADLTIHGFNNNDSQFEIFYDLGKQVSDVIGVMVSPPENVQNDDNHWVQTKNEDLEIIGLGFKLSPRVDKGIDERFYFTNQNEFKKWEKEEHRDDLEEMDKRDKKLEENLKKLNEQFYQLIKILREKYKFKTSLIEISLFDPEDTSSTLFYTFIFAPHKELIADYMRELRNNTLGSKNPSRGQILSNASLYDFPLVHLDYKASFSSPELDTNGDEDIYCLIRIGTIYEVAPENNIDSRRNNESASTETGNLRKYIGNFWLELPEKVFVKAEKKYSHINTIIDVNIALLIPVLRPSGRGNENQKALQGGGAFFYGEFDEALGNKNNSIKDLGLWIKNQLDVATMKQSNTKASVQRAQYDSMASILHYIPYAFSESVKQLTKYQKTHPDFEIPIALYVVAVETALYARLSDDREELKKFIFWLPIEDILKEKGLGREFFDELSNERGMSRCLTEYSLSTHSNPIFSKQLKKPKVVVKGHMSFGELGLTDDIKVRVFIALLIILLKESLESTERYLSCVNDVNNQQVEVTIQKKLVVITYPKSERMNWGAIEGYEIKDQAISLFKKFLISEVEVCEIYSPNETASWELRIK